MEQVSQPAGSAAGKLPGKPFAPGQSGNPGGRLKIKTEFQAAMENSVPAAVKVLIDGLSSDKIKHVEWAAELILAYAVGKPKQAVELSGQDGNPIGIEVIRRVIVDPGHRNP